MSPSKRRIKLRGEQGLGSSSERKRHGLWAKFSRGYMSPVQVKSPQNVLVIF